MVYRYLATEEAWLWQEIKNVEPYAGVVFRYLIAAVACSMLFSCTQNSNPLAGTNWRLVEFQSMDDAIGTIRPADPSVFTMRLDRDGSVSMRLDCNRATGNWSAEPANGGDSGRFEFGQLASTRALCPPPNLDERIVNDAQFLRGYMLRDGRLYLSLMADAGIYTWEPAP